MSTNIITLITLYIYLIICSITDIKTKKINLKVCMFFLFSGFFINIFYIKSGTPTLIYNLIPGVFLLIISILTKGAVGCGDAVIFITMAFYMPSFYTLNILFLSLFTAALFSIILMTKKYSSKYALPFAPFITLGFTLFILLQFL